MASPTVDPKSLTPDQLNSGDYYITRPPALNGEIGNIYLIKDMDFEHLASVYPKMQTTLFSLKAELGIAREKIARLERTIPNIEGLVVNLEKAFKVASKATK
jgi:hypothetical protein